MHTPWRCGTTTRDVKVSPQPCKERSHTIDNIVRGLYYFVKLSGPRKPVAAHRRGPAAARLAGVLRADVYAGPRGGLRRPAALVRAPLPLSHHCRHAAASARRTDGHEQARGG